MWSLLVVEAEVIGQSFTHLINGCVPFEIDVFVFHRPPQSFSEYVVEAAASAVHADGNLFFKQEAGVLRRGEVGSLVGIMNGWRCDRERPFDIFKTEINLQCWGELPRDHVPAVPVDDGDEVAEAAVETNVRDIGAPDVVWIPDLKLPQEVRVDTVQMIRFARIVLWIQGFKSQKSHRCANGVPAHLNAIVIPQGYPHSPLAIERVLRIDRVESAEEPEVFRRGRQRLCIHGATGNTEELSLPCDGDSLASSFYQRTQLTRATIQIFFGAKLIRRHGLR